MKIVVESVTDIIYKGQVKTSTDGNFPFVLNTVTGEYRIGKEAINKVNWTFAMKQLLPNQAVNMV